MDRSVHPSADVQTDKIGTNTVIWQFCVILPGAVIGADCNINCNCFIENDVKIGNNVTIKSGVQLWDGVTIEDNVFVGPNVTFTNDLIPRSKVYPAAFAKTLVKTGASIGGNATIIAGIEIGAFALVGAGSVVTKNIPPYTTWYGNPARHKGFITDNSILLDLNLFDKTNGVQYVLDGDKPMIR